jgi:predicted CxxxxCH...CXXCH cytochrome family protein
MKTLIVSIVAVSALLLFGCTELNKDLPPPVAPGVQVHEQSWLDTSSTGFHGTVIRQNNGNYQSCLTCHGWDFGGGTSSVSCVTCHQAEGGSIHGRGWVNPASPNFHGNTIRANNWDMRECQSCHGPTYSGGRVNSSCRDCHTGGGGPENCATCHGGTNPAPPRDLSKNTSSTARGVGAHQIHLLGSPLSGPVRCTECHTVPGAMYDPGHVDSPAPTEIMFNRDLARTVTNEPTTQNWDPLRPPFTPSPAYDYAQGSCGTVYCHGYFKNGNNANAPVWNATNQAACGTCHGDPTAPTTAQKALPGGTHPNVLTCSNCHGGVVNANLQIINPAKHIDGLLNLFGSDRDY